MNAAEVRPVSPVMPTYNRADVAFERGEGPYLCSRATADASSTSRAASRSRLGHAHPASGRGADRAGPQALAHLQPLPIPGQERLAERLVASTFADTVFFGNSGAEALECAIKMVRKYHATRRVRERYRIITFEGAFHGRTLATIAAGGQKKYLEGLRAARSKASTRCRSAISKPSKAAIGPETAGILIEPIQGEGGVRPLRAGVPARHCARCATSTGCCWCSTRCRAASAAPASCSPMNGPACTPDIMAIAKAIGGGFPVGACLATEKAAAGMTAGTHGSTFGGNPLAMAVGNAVLDVVLAPASWTTSSEVAQPSEPAAGHAGRASHRDVIRGGARRRACCSASSAKLPNAEVVDALRERGLLTVGAGDNVVRLLPPLIIEEARARGDRHDRAGLHRPRGQPAQGKAAS